MSALRHRGAKLCLRQALTHFLMKMHDMMLKMYICDLIKLMFFIIVSLIVQLSLININAISHILS